MTFASTMTWARALLARIAAGPAAADDDVPMGARVGGSISIDPTPFLLAGNTLVPAPGDLLQIESISRLRAGMQGAVHRFYTARGDNGDGPECFLQVYTDPVGVAREMVYFHRLLRLFPASREEQSAYLGEEGAGLGQATFTLHRQQFEGLDLPPVLIDQAFGKSEVIQYERSAGSPEQEHISPFRGSETRIDDSRGRNGLRQDVVFMPYRRDLPGGGEEQLLICTEVVQEQDGVAARREIHVDFMVGLVLTEEYATVH